MKRAWLALVVACALGAVAFGLGGIIAFPYMLVSSALLFMAFKALGWLRWWHTALAGLFAGIGWAVLLEATASFDYWDSIGITAAIGWGVIGVLTGLIFWCLGLYRNSSFPKLDRSFPYAMLTVIPIAAATVLLHRTVDVISFAHGRVIDVSGEMPKRRVTVRLSNGSVVQTYLRKDSRPSSVL